MSARRLGASRSAQRARINGGGYAAFLLSLGPQAYYRHGEASGTTMVDSSGNGRDGTYAGPPTLGTSSLLNTDPLDSAITLSGSTQKGTVTNASWMNGWGGITLVGWIKPSGSGTNRDIISRDTSGVNGPWRLRLSTGNKLEFLLWDTSLSDLVGVTSVGASARTHYAATWDGTTQKVYLGGALDNSKASSGSFNAATTDIIIGNYGAADESFGGVVDETAIFNYALTAQNIADLFSLGG